MADQGPPRFDVDAFFTALDRERRARRLRWRDVAREAGVSASPSAFSRMGLDLKRPDANSLVRMLVWLGTTDVGPYITREPEEDD